MEIPPAKSSLEFARSIFAAEAEAIMRLASTLDASFDAAVQALHLLAPEGRVIVSGMGKAGFVAMKISATLASTGTPSFFLHPAEAVHGDLGRYTGRDIALILSNSGETPEILRMLGPVKRMGCPILSITAHRESSLAKHSDICLTIGRVEEAGPLKLAPTTSTTVMLALGDALAMCVLEKKNLSREQFAFFHPGGNLGRALTPVSEVMRVGDEHCVVAASLTTREVLQRLSKTPGRPGAASVVAENGTLAGVFTNGDVRRCLENGVEFLAWPIEQVMSRNPKTVRPIQLVEEALHILRTYQIDEIIVVDEANRPVGMVDIQDIVDFER